MLPVFRWCLCGFGALWCCAVWAQAATPQPEVDESKIPEWVKRQARSPYKVIIDSNTVKAKPAAPKEDAGAKTVAKRPPVKTAAAAPEIDKSASTIVLPAASTATASPSIAPAAAVETATVPAPQQQPASENIVAAAPASLSARTATAEPPPLTLLKRIEPVLSADLLDSRLNTAKVVVAFTVTAGGEVSNLSIASTTDSRLNRPVLRALQAWRYAPIPEPREHMVSFAFATE
jgi:TonB family protein